MQWAMKLAITNHEHRWQMKDLITLRRAAVIARVYPA
jgi:hypothetical protein